MLSKLDLFGIAGRGASTRCASILAFLCAVALVAPATAAAPVVRSFDFEIHSSLGTIAWMDDRTLALKAMVKVEGDRPTDYSGKRVGKLAFLDTETGRVQWGPELNGAFCVNGRQVAYFRIEDVTEAGGRSERVFVSFGPLGEMKTREVKREDLLAQRFDFAYSCKPVSELPQAPGAGPREFVQRLHVGHGFVAFETRGSRDVPSKFYPARQPSGALALPALNGEDVLVSWPYAPFRNVYWISQAVRTWPLQPPGTYKAWWLHPDGRVSLAVELDLQKSLNGPYSLVPAFPVRNGFLAIERRTRRTPLLGNIGRSGLYRLEGNGKHERLIAGTVSPWAVSPNGCRVAVGHDDRRDDEGTERMMLKILDVCRSE